MNFGERLAAAVRRAGNPVLVGLDPRAEQLPAGLLADGETDPAQIATAYATFCRGVIDVVAPLVACVKPQAAFFEQLGPSGMAALAEVIRTVRKRYFGGAFGSGFGAVSQTRLRASIQRGRSSSAIPQTSR